MATFRLITYMILDEIKSVNGDSYITEEHVRFLANQYRLLLLKQKADKEMYRGLSDSDTQTICVELELTTDNIGLCENTYLRSIKEIPDTVSGTTLDVRPYDRFNVMISCISKDRMKYVGYNKYLKNIIYCCIDEDRLYIKSSNPLFRYLEKVWVTGVFEDAEKAAQMECCEEEGDNNKCKDYLDSEFPLSGELVPLMIQLIVLELYQALVRPADNQNNSSDDISDIVAYVRRNMKSNLAKQFE